MSDSLKCERCGCPEPTNYYLDKDDRIIGCDQCPDLHKWLYGTCELCGVEFHDEVDIVCPVRGKN